MNASSVDQRDGIVGKGFPGPFFSTLLAGRSGAVIMAVAVVALALLLIWLFA